MNQFISTLTNSYSRVVGKAGVNSELTPIYNSLRLADALLDKVELIHSDPEHPAQITILGPTQAGKSTLVNLLLDANAAGVSALAGYTVHAQGFASITADKDLATIHAMFEPLELKESRALDPENLNAYSLNQIEVGSNSIARNCIVWDSPDFDSIESNGYRGAVLKTAAIADIVIVMLSKDKYGDKTVWDMLGLLNECGIPHLVCINKLNQNDQLAVVESFNSRYQEQYSIDPPTLLVIPYIDQSVNASLGSNRQSRSDSDSTISLDTATRDEIATAVSQLLQNVERGTRSSTTQAFIKSHWDEWLTPIREENQANKTWDELVETVLIEAMDEYDARYLENPQKYDTFNRAIAELLNLLEIPGIAKGLAKTRSVVTWPARKLFGLGKEALNPTEANDAIDYEKQMLSRVCDQAMTKLQSHILAQSSDAPNQEHWWRSLHERFSEQSSGIQTTFDFEIDRYQSDFEPRIEEAAQSLYSRLQEQPTLLNTLRATRATTDAAAVVLAVKSGGLAAADLIIAPAMLSVTTLLTESVLGKYMDSVKKELKEQQFAIVEIMLFEKFAKNPLLAMPDELDKDRVFGIPAESIPEYP